MTITNGYTTLALIKARLWPTGVTPDTSEDTMLENIIMAVSRSIDNYTARRFWVNSNDETRYYRAQSRQRVLPDDIVSVTSLATDADGDGTYEDTWTTADYNLLPVNASLDSIPYNLIEVTPDGDYSFPANANRKAVKVVGKFGWSTAPYPVQEACIIQSIRLFRRKDAPFGVTGGGEMGQAVVIAKLDPDVEMLLRPYVRIV